MNILEISCVTKLNLGLLIRATTNLPTTKQLLKTFLNKSDYVYIYILGLGEKSSSWNIWY